MYDDFLKYWPILGPGSALIVWFVRVEAGMKRNRAEIERLVEQFSGEQKAADEYRAELTVKVTSIDVVVTEVSRQLEIANGDIKNILEKLP